MREGESHDHDTRQGKSDTPPGAANGSLWTLARLRQTIASQGSAPLAGKIPVKTSAAPAATALPGATAAPLTPAPALHNSTPEEPAPEPKNGTETNWLWIPLAGALFAVVWLLRKRG
jgi:hypothetical protein